MHSADVVFARCPGYHLFPSGVEIGHFAQAAEGKFERRVDMAEIPAPVLGYFGVVDERMDLPLLAHLAQTYPEWQIVK